MMMTTMKQEYYEWDARACDICESAPRKVYCRADSAYLCAGCDNDIHSANPLASRHSRVPLLPMSGGLYAPHANRGMFFEDEAASSWLLLNSLKNNDNQPLSFGREEDGDQYLDLVEYNDDEQYMSGSVFPDGKSFGLGDSVVPKITKDEQLQFKQPDYIINPSVTQTTISISSKDVGIVPESPVITQLSPMDREARVMRYREKKKMRKFDKTIRYASRKAYAETRPRIKGRFAKRTDAQFEADNMFSTSLMVETGYGIVPSF